jgi:ACS family glucarate transporter-like MFS transporter
MTNPTTVSVAERHPYRWVVLALSWAAFTMTAVDRATWGPAAASVGEDLGVTLAGLGVFATGYYIGYVISNAGGGFLSDWLGPRVVIGTSLSIAGVFMILFGETESIGLGIAFQAGVGVFAGCDYSAGVKLISQWFIPKDRGFAMGIFLTATSLGAVIANAIVPSLIVSSGWRTSYHVFGVASIVVALLAFVLLRGRNSPVQETREVPNLRPLARNRDLWLLGMAGFGGIWGTLGFTTWANVLMTKGSQISPVQAGLIVAIFAGIAIGAKPLIGFVSDLFFGGRRKALTVIVLGTFVVSLLVFGTRSTFTGFLWVAPFLGIAAYVYSPLMVAMIPKLAGVRLAGSAAGATNAFWQIASTIVPTVVGAVFAASGSFFWAFATLAAGPLLGMICMLGVREQPAVEEPAEAAAAAVAR